MGYTFINAKSSRGEIRSGRKSEVRRWRRFLEMEVEKGGGKCCREAWWYIYIERGSWERSNPLKIISSRIIREHLYEAESVVDVENKIRLVAVNARMLFEICSIRRKNSIYFSYIIPFCWSIQVENKNLKPRSNSNINRTNVVFTIIKKKKSLIFPRKIFFRQRIIHPLPRSV